jgi:hypothetical protein
MRSPAPSEIHPGRTTCRDAATRHGETGVVRKEKPVAETARHRTPEQIPEPRVPEYTPPPEPTDAWGGWVTFAGITLILVGVIHLIEGLVALTEPEQYLVGSRGLVLQLDYTAWGWIHLIGGVVLIAAGAGVLNRNRLARIVGVVAAGLSALANLSFLSAAPVYALTVITLDVVFVFAITVHGGEVPASRGNERSTGFTGPGAP